MAYIHITLNDDDSISRFGLKDTQLINFGVVLDGNHIPCCEA